MVYLFTTIESLGIIARLALISNRLNKNFTFIKGFRIVFNPLKNDDKECF